MVIAIVLYLIALGVTFYDKYCVMLDRWEKPNLYHSPFWFSSFFVIKVALCLAYVGLFYRMFGIPVALSAFVVQFILGAVLLRIFYRKRVSIWYPHCLNAVRNRPREGGHPPSEADINSEAKALARAAALKAMRDEE